MDIVLWAVLSTLLGASAAQQHGFPSSPCPDIFQYLGDSRGLIRVWPPRSGLPLYLRVSLFLPASLPSKYAGRLALAEDKDLVFQRLQAGLKDRVKYHLLFPLSYPVPQIDRIVVNNDVVCQGPPVRAPILTKISLDHTLYPIANSLTSPNNGLDTFGPVSPGEGFNNGFNNGFEPEDGGDVFFGPDEYFEPNNRPASNQFEGSTSNNRPASNQFETSPSNNRPSSNQFEGSTSNNRPNFNQFGTSSNNRPNFNQFETSPSNNRPSSNPFGVSPSNSRPGSGQGGQFGGSGRPGSNQFEMFVVNERPNSSEGEVNTRPNPSNQGVQFEISAANNRPEEPTIGSPWMRPTQNQQQPSRFTPNVPSKEICGRPIQANELVVNGQRTQRGEWPWISAIFTTTNRGQDFLCSGSLFTRRHVVTAGHCVKARDRPQVSASILVVYLGKYRLRRFAEPDVQPREVQQVFLHPDYGASENYDADLAVLLLDQPAEFSRYVVPVCLWDQSPSLTPVVGRLGSVVGWGRDEEGHKATDEPRLVEMPIVSQETCLHSRMDYISITSNRTLCAGFRNNTGPCNGDSGSGMVLSFPDTSSSRQRWYIRGLVSVSLYDQETNSCDLANYVVFTDLAKHKEWMASFTD